MCFLKAFKILNLKVVPNDTFKFDGEIFNLNLINSPAFVRVYFLLLS